MPATIHTVKNLHMVSPKNWITFSGTQHWNVWKLAHVLFPTTAAVDLIKDIASPYKTFVLFISLEQHSYSNSIHSLQDNLCFYLTAIHSWI